MERNWQRVCMVATFGHMKNLVLLTTAPPAQAIQFAQNALTKPIPMHLVSVYHGQIAPLVSIFRSVEMAPKIVNVKPVSLDTQMRPT